METTQEEIKPEETGREELAHGAGVKWIEIENFKSIKKLHLDCKRVNLFVGRPNVGKSNILEALSLFSLGLKESTDTENIIRYKNLNELFYDRDRTKKIQIKTDQKLYLTLVGLESKSEYELVSNNFDLNKADEMYVSEVGHTSGKISLGSSLFGYYTYSTEGDKFVSPSIDYLKTPYGNNLYSMIENSKELARLVASFFEEFGYKLILAQDNNKLLIQKTVDEFMVNQLPFHLISDTLRRQIFYITAIRTNHNSALIFEEPESHTFPPYIRFLANEIAESKNNQFFITTHSPYLVRSLLEYIPLDALNVVITFYENYQTHIIQLTNDMVEDIRYNEMDIFYNLEQFLDND